LVSVDSLRLFCPNSCGGDSFADSFLKEEDARLLADEIGCGTLPSVVVVIDSPPSTVEANIRGGEDADVEASLPA